MKLTSPLPRRTHRPAIAEIAVLAAVVAGSLALAGCEPRRRDPKPPSDPGHNVPKPITTAALPTWAAWAGPAARR